MKVQLQYKQYGSQNRECEFLLEITTETTDAFATAPKLLYSTLMNFNADDTIVSIQHKNEALAASTTIRPVVMTSLPTHNIISSTLFVNVAASTASTTFKDVVYTTPSFNTVPMSSLLNLSQSPFTIGFELAGANQTAVKKVTFKIVTSRFRDGSNSIVIV